MRYQKKKRKHNDMSDSDDSGSSWDDGAKQRAYVDYDDKVVS